MRFYFDYFKKFKGSLLLNQNIKKKQTKLSHDKYYLNSIFLNRKNS